MQSPRREAAVLREGKTREQLSSIVCLYPKRKDVVRDVERQD